MIPGMKTYPTCESNESLIMYQVADLPELDLPTRLSTPGELAALVPYLVGFHPTESVVLLAFIDSRLAVTARFGLDLCQRADLVDQQIEQIKSHFPDARHVLVGYAEDRQAAEDALSMVEFLVGTEAVIDSLYVRGSRYWSRMCTSPHCCPPEGRSFDAETSPVAVQAIVAGLQALPRREDLAKRVQSPRGGAAQAARRNIDDAHAASSALPDADLVDNIDALLDAGLADAAALDQRELALLSVLIDRPGLRDRALRRITMDNREAQLRLWERLVRSTPRVEQGPALGLMGLSAWVCGEGALQSICLERAEQSQLWHPLLQIVADIHQLAAPPALWERLRAGLIDGLGEADQ